MPIFVYGCNDCDATWEDIQVKSTDKPPTSCPSCDSSKIQKRPTTAGQRWTPSDGQGGWVRRADGSHIRVTEGKNSQRYGEGLG